jgi:AAA family ATP:ADP antiporter
MASPPLNRTALQRLLNLAPGERAGLLRGMLYGFLVLAGHAVLKPVRDEIGSELRDWLPVLWTWTFIGTCVLAPLYGLAAARWPKERLVPRVLLVCIGCLAVFWALLRGLPPGPSRTATEAVFYVWTSVFNLYTVSLFWAQMTALYRSEQGRRLFGLLTLGSSMGAIAGPLLVRLLAGPLGNAQMLPIAAGLLGGAAICSRATALRSSPVAGATAVAPGDLRGVATGLRTLFRSRYLMAVAGYLLLSLVGAGFLYFLKAEIAGEAFTDRARRLEFFALVEAAGNSLTVLLQIFVTGRVMGRFGTLPALLVLPVLTAGLFAALGTWTTLPVLVACDLGRRAGNYAFSKPAREVLYTVVDERARYRTKPLLDTVVYRGGDVGVAWLYEALASAGMAAGALAWAVVPCALAWAVLAVPLGRGHRRRETTASASEPRIDPE